MKQLKEILGTVRIDENGKEVEMPTPDDYVHSNGSKMLDRYHKATEVVKLVPLSEFWKLLRNHKEGFEPSFITIEYNLYVEFATQPLTKGMFIPTDEEGNLLEVKTHPPTDDEDYDKWNEELEAYRNAKDRVIFEGDLQHSDLDEGNIPYIELKGWEINIDKTPMEFVNLETGEETYPTTIEHAINDGVSLYYKID